MNDLISKIRKIIFDQYKCIFNGKLEVLKNSSGYSLIIGIPSNDKPSTINIDGSEEDFIKYLTEELKINKRYISDFRKVELNNYD